MADPRTRTQRLIQRLLPQGLASRAEQESKEWHLICTKCGHATSYWELGGIRMGAWSKGKRMRRRCRACGDVNWHPVERIRS